MFCAAKQPERDPPGLSESPDALLVAGIDGLAPAASFMTLEELRQMEVGVGLAPTGGGIGIPCSQIPAGGALRHMSLPPPQRLFRFSRDAARLRSQCRTSCGRWRRR